MDDAVLVFIVALIGIGAGIAIGLSIPKEHDFQRGRATERCESKSGEYRDGKCWTKAVVIQ